MKDYETTARVANRPFMPIVLLCDVAENRRRAHLSKRKDSVSIFSAIVYYRVLCRATGPRCSRSLDVTTLSAVEAAKAIFNMTKDAEGGVGVVDVDEEAGEDGEGWALVSCDNTHN